MYRDPYTNQPVHADEPTFTIIALEGWTNHIVETLDDVPLSGIDWAAERLLFYAWDSAGGPQTRTVIAVPSQWRTQEWNEHYEYWDSLIRQQNLQEHELHNVPLLSDEVRHREVLYHLDDSINYEYQTWTTTSGVPKRRQRQRSELSRMRKYSRFVAQYIAQPDGSPTPMGAPTAPPEAPNYDVLTHDDMVPWDDNTVGELGSGPGVAN